METDLARYGNFEAFSGSSPTPTHKPASVARSTMHPSAGLFSRISGTRVASTASAAMPGIVSNEREPQSRAISALCHCAEARPSSLDWPGSATLRNQRCSSGWLRVAYPTPTATMELQAAPAANQTKRSRLIRTVDRTASVFAMGRKRTRERCPYFSSRRPPLNASAAGSQSAESCPRKAASWAAAGRGRRRTSPRARCGSCRRRCRTLP